MQNYINSLSGNPFVKMVIIAIVLDTSLGAQSFYNCKSLKTVIISNSVIKIQASTFNSCSSLTSITIPDSVTSIEGYAFGYCTKLIEVTIPNSVTSIGSYAFQYTGLTSVTIAEDCTYASNSFPSGCTINRY